MAGKVLKQNYVFHKLGTKVQLYPWNISLKTFKRINFFVSSGLQPGLDSRASAPYKQENQPFTF